MTPPEGAAEHSAMVEVMLACAGRDPGGGDPTGLDAYVRATAWIRLSSIPAAIGQLRHHAAEWDGKPIVAALGGEALLPDVGVPEGVLGPWMRRTAETLAARWSSGTLPAPGIPDTHWEWQTRFPETMQFLGGWFGQDFSEEFTDHDEAVADYLRGTDLTVVARLLGELTELSALAPRDTDLLAGLLELGLEIDPPEGLGPAAWIRGVAERLEAGIGAGRTDG